MGHPCGVPGLPGLLPGGRAATGARPLHRGGKDCRRTVQQREDCWSVINGDITLPLSMVVHDLLTLYSCVILLLSGLLSVLLDVYICTWILDVCNMCVCMCVRYSFPSQTSLLSSVFSHAYVVVPYAQSLQSHMNQHRIIWPVESMGGSTATFSGKCVHASEDWGNRI